MSIRKVLSIFAICTVLLSLVLSLAVHGEGISAAAGGFELIQDRFVPEIGAVVKVFRHTKSGATVLYLGNDDENKVFAITFRTPPKDNTGVSHILEHSVLAGSRKYPVKELINELSKGSLSTFLNAMTLPDRTMYPIASRNHREFRNLMDVYLDAVFYPNVCQDRRIFEQEGWHYELLDPEDELTYNGVVYNEMKGQYSNPEYILFRTQIETLFPDTPYQYSYGGDPQEIPNLQYEDLLQFHQTYYHPSNSLIYLYGNLDLEATLEFIDQEYLSAFDHQRVQSDILYQEPFDSERVVVREYPVAPGEGLKDKTYLSKSYVIGRGTDTELVYAFSILEWVLLQTEASPLKRALIDAGIGQKVTGSFFLMPQPVFSIEAHNANESDRERFAAVVEETLRKLAAEGLDRTLLEAAVNQVELSMRKDATGAQRGLEYLYVATASWAQGADPVSALEIGAVMERIRQRLSTGYFESLIEKYLLNNPHCATVVLRPDPHLADRQKEQVRQELALHKTSLSKAQLDELVKQTKALKQWQAQPTAVEDLAKLPSLTLDDLNPEPERFPTVEHQVDGVKVLHHSLFTNKVAYIDLYFDTTVVPQDKLPYLHLLANVLGKVSTANRHYTDLAKEISFYTGGIGYQATAYPQYRNSDVYYPKLVVASEALVQQVPHLMRLLGEILMQSQFDDASRLQQIVDEEASNSRAFLLQAGHYVAMTRLLSYLSPYYQYEEQALLPYHKFILELRKEFPERSQEVAANLREVGNLVFNRSGLMVSITVDGEEYSSVAQHLPILLEELGQDTHESHRYSFETASKNEGLALPSQVQYVAKGFSYRNLQYPYSGKMQVLRNVLESDYLWNRIRVQGGAYGAFAMFAHWGDVWFVSYRDPNLAKTLDSYDGIPEFLKSFSADDRSMTKYIIGTISRMETPLDPASKGRLAARYYIQGTTYADRERLWKEILSTTAENIREYAGMMEIGLRNGYLCVVGSEQKLRENKELFGEIIPLLE